MQAVAYYLCRVDGKGRAEKVAERKTFRGISRLADRKPGLFVVTAFLAADERASDFGTVYFYDLNGGQVEMASC